MVNLATVLARSIPDDSEDTMSEPGALMTSIPIELPWINLGEDVGVALRKLGHQDHDAPEDLMTNIPIELPWKILGRGCWSRLARAWPSRT